MRFTMKIMVATLGLMAMTLAALPLYLHLQEMARAPRPLGPGPSLNPSKKFLGGPVLSRPRAGLGVTAPVTSESRVIPKVIHYSYKFDLTNTSRPFPSITFALSWKAWRQHFPESEYRYQFWSDEDNRRCIEENFPEYLEDWLALRDRPEKFDMARMCYLYAHGGIYQDLDYEPLRCFYDELTLGHVHLVGSPYDEHSLPPLDDGLKGVQVQNSLMASPKGHPFWQKAFWWVFVQGRGLEHHWSAAFGSGPCMLGSVANRYPELPVAVLPPAAFQPQTQELTWPMRWRRWLESKGVLQRQRYAGIHWGAWSYAIKDLSKSSPIEDLVLFAEVNGWCPGVTPTSAWDYCGDPRLGVQPYGTV